MSQTISELKNEIAISLWFEALSFMRIGLYHFYQFNKRKTPMFQTAISNLSISVELMLKALICDKCFYFLFKDISKETAIFITYPNSMPESYNENISLIDIRSGTHKTIELNDCIGLLYIIRPDLKELLQPYLSRLSSIRNNSVHYFIPDYQQELVANLRN